MRLSWPSRRRVRHKPLVQVPFLGRDALLQALHQRLQGAREGAGQYVFVEGEHGSGKSALLKMFVLLHCAAREVMPIQLHTGDWLMPPEFSIHLLRELREQSHTVLQTIYNDTKRLRKMLGLQFDEAEFAHLLLSADWTQFDQQTPVASSWGKRRDAPLLQLLAAVRQHPWGVGAATILDFTARKAALGGLQENWLEHWQQLCLTLTSRPGLGGACLVVLIDQLECLVTDDAARQRAWIDHWGAFTAVTQAADVPVMVVWTGTPESLLPVQEAIEDVVPVVSYTTGALDDEETGQLLSRLRKRLPRDRHDTWHQFCTSMPEPQRLPGVLLLAAGWTASIAPTEQESRSTFPDATTMVHELVEAIAQQHPDKRGLLDQLLEVWAFLPPDRPMSVDELFLLCDVQALGFDPVSGRTALEMLLGACVRYGLIDYDAYAPQYSTGHQVIQEALQRLAYPDPAERQTVARQRQVAASILHHLRSGRHDMLRALTPAVGPDDSGETPTYLVSYVRRPVERLLAQSSKEERQRLAGALGSLRSPLAVELLATMLRDTEGQVRSGAVQSLADLEEPYTRAALLTACRDVDSDVRWIAAQALGKIADMTTVDALIALLTDDDKEVGRIAAQGLGSKGDTRAVPHLIAVLNDSYPLLRESAALALGELADRRAFPALQALLQDSNRQVRRGAEKALERFGSLGQ
jgi:hypothetical protein